MKIRHILPSIAAFLLVSTASFADDGMWLPSLISQRIADMQAKGFKLTAEDIYSVNQASLKDAVVLFGSGCTGEIVSKDGLLLTNHHCGYSQIQQHSSVDHDYLKDGFWAMRRSEELPNPGLTVKFLDRMEDVTGIILKGCQESMTEAQRDSLVRANSSALMKQATAEGKGLRASVEAMYYGNQYYLFVYREFSDVRLVGAPPSSIGKFGGDTDNWMWPRHTGDFSMFRVYADKNNEPAAYSEDNVPYQPKRFLKISTKGVQEGDFTFVYGFPGSTQEYIHSKAVAYTAEISDPVKIDLRTRRLDIQKKYMSASQAVRIQYSSKNASVSNAWKKWQGEAKGLVRNDIVTKKADYEKRFEAWAHGTRYEGITTKLGRLYDELEKYSLAVDYYSETAYTTEIASFANRWVSMASREVSTLDEIMKLLDDIKALESSFFKDYYLPIDKESFIAVMNVFEKDMAQDMKPAWYLEQLASYGSVEAWAEEIFSKSIFRSPASCEEAVRTVEPIVAAGLGTTLKEGTMDKALEFFKADPAYQFYTNMYKWYTTDIYPRRTELNREITLLMRDYMNGQMEFEPQKDFFPDANLTLRVAYGNVGGYSPKDGVWYNPVSTLKGIIEKDNPEIFDYNIPQTLRDIYADGIAKGGAAAEKVKNQPVCFLATNHTTGGNSGSPVINADGELIGLNFDRVWEGTMSDLAFDPSFCRNITLDIRYLLFLVKEIGGAQWLIDEMLGE